MPLMSAGTSYKILSQHISGQHHRYLRENGIFKPTVVHERETRASLIGSRERRSFLRHQRTLSLHTWTQWCRKISSPLNDRPWNTRHNMEPATLLNAQQGVHANTSSTHNHSCGATFHNLSAGFAPGRPDTSGWCTTSSSLKWTDIYVSNDNEMNARL